MQIRKMTRENIPVHAHGHGAGGPLLAQDTGKETSVTNFSFGPVKQDVNETTGSGVPYRTWAVRKRFSPLCSDRRSKSRSRRRSHSRSRRRSKSPRRRRSHSRDRSRRSRSRSVCEPGTVLDWLQWTAPLLSASGGLVDWPHSCLLKLLTLRVP